MQPTLILYTMAYTEWLTVFLSTKGSATSESPMELEPVGPCTSKEYASSSIVQQRRRFSFAESCRRYGIGEDRGIHVVDTSFSARRVKSCGERAPCTRSHLTPSLPPRRSRADC